ncbi:hypothetical protein RGAI101_4109 [Roseobacter sp. GAI101]|nr:hypothetical protein RGAI101_4109 [Roseobacter sp. GAI101]
MSVQIQKISSKSHQFPPRVVAHVVWRGVLFELSQRDILHKAGI